MSAIRLNIITDVEPVWYTLVLLTTPDGFFTIDDIVYPVMSYWDTLDDAKSAITALLTLELFPDDINPFGEKPIENLSPHITHHNTHHTRPSRIPNITLLTNSGQSTPP